MQIRAQVFDEVPRTQHFEPCDGWSYRTALRAKLRSRECRARSPACVVVCGEPQPIQDRGSPDHSCMRRRARSVGPTITEGIRARNTGNATRNFADRTSRLGACAERRTSSDSTGSELIPRPEAENTGRGAVASDATQIRPGSVVDVVAHGVRTARAADVDSLAATLTSVFDDDPLTMWLFPNVEARRRKLPAFFRSLLRASLPFGEVYTTDEERCVAIWNPPGTFPLGWYTDALAGTHNDPSGGSTHRGMCPRSAVLREPSPQGPPLVPANARDPVRVARPRRGLGDHDPRSRTLRPGRRARVPGVIEGAQHSLLHEARVSRHRRDPGTQRPSRVGHVARPALRPPFTIGEGATQRGREGLTHLRVYPACRRCVRWVCWSRKRYGRAASGTRIPLLGVIAWPKWSRRGVRGRRRASRSTAGRRSRRAAGLLRPSAARDDHARRP